MLQGRLAPTSPREVRITNTQLPSAPTAPSRRSRCPAVGHRQPPGARSKSCSVQRKGWCWSRQWTQVTVTQRKLLTDNNCAGKVNNRSTELRVLYSGTHAQQVLPQMQLQTGRRTKQSPETRGAQQARVTLWRETSPWPTLSEGKPQPPGLEKQDTYLPGCHAGEDRTLEAAATGGADCLEPSQGDLGQGEPARHPPGSGERGVRSLKPGCGRELPVLGGAGLRPGAPRRDWQSPAGASQRQRRAPRLGVRSSNFCNLEKKSLNFPGF